MFPSSGRTKGSVRKREAQFRYFSWTILGTIGYVIILSFVTYAFLRNLYSKSKNLKEDIKDINATLTAEINDLKNVSDTYLPCWETICPLQNCTEHVCETYDEFMEIAMFWGGCWNAENNTTPDGSPIVSGMGENGETYVVCVASNTTVIDGQSDFQLYDLIIFDQNTSRWYKIDGSPEALPNVTTLSDSGVGQTLIINGDAPSLVIYKIIAGNGIFFSNNVTGIQIQTDTIADSATNIMTAADFSWLDIRLSGTSGSMGAGVYEFVPNLVVSGASRPCHVIRKRRTVEISCSIGFTSPTDQFDMVNNVSPFDAVVTDSIFVYFETCFTGASDYEADIQPDGGIITYAGISNMLATEFSSVLDPEHYWNCGTFIPDNAQQSCPRWHGQIFSDCLNTNMTSWSMDFTVSYRASNGIPPIL